MTERKRKLIIIQISLLLIGSLIILFTYSDLEVTDKEKIITAETQQKIEEQLKNDVKDIMSSINEASLPKINATTALIGAVGGAATATAADPMAGFDRRRSTGEKPVVKVYIGDTEDLK